MLFLIKKNNKRICRQIIRIKFNGTFRIKIINNPCKRDFKFKWKPIWKSNRQNLRDFEWLIEDEASSSILHFPLSFRWTLCHRWILQVMLYFPFICFLIFPNNTYNLHYQNFVYIVCLCLMSLLYWISTFFVVGVILILVLIFISRFVFMRNISIFILLIHWFFSFLL